jgi:hypothetical protein
MARQDCRLSTRGSTKSRLGKAFTKEWEAPPPPDRAFGFDRKPRAEKTKKRKRSLYISTRKAYYPRYPRSIATGGCMSVPRYQPETPIERIFREVTGNKMTAAVKRILLPKEEVVDSPVEYLRMRSNEWIKTLADGVRVKFTNQELPNLGAFITAQVAGNKVVYSIVLTNAKKPLSRQEVESHFEAELSKK